MVQMHEANAPTPPCLILAHPDPGYAGAIARSFRRLGWDVYFAHSGPEARRLARMLEADVVLLDAELPQESGWLTCDKLTHEQPLVKVILVGEDLRPRQHDLAAFVGASALVGREDSLDSLVEELRRPAVHAAG